MKLLIFADSHGRGIGMVAAIEREKPDGVIHLGDHAGDARDLQRIYPLLPIYRVRGNNDFDADVPLQAAIQPDNVSIYITHGHRDRVSMMSWGRVPQNAREQGCRLAFFGHTHRMLLERVDGVTVCNPGSISLPRGGPAGYARLTIENSRPVRLELLDEDGALLRAQKF